MKQSTKAMFRMHGWRLDRSLHNYIYFVFYRPYVSLFYAVLLFIRRRMPGSRLAGLIGTAAFNRYHAKILSLDDTVKILTLNQDVRAVSDENKKIIPFDYAYKIIFNDPGSIAVMDCPCKLATGAPRDTVHSCIAVGREVTSFWMEHCGKYNPEMISGEEAIDMIKKLRKKGHINQAFLKVATGGKTGVICTCHPDTCVSLIASQILSGIKNGAVQYAISGYSVNHDSASCTFCSTCESVCHFNAVSFIEGKRIYKTDLCAGCGLCVEHCTSGALSLYRDPEKPLPMDMDLVRSGLA